MKDINSRIDKEKGVIYLTEKERTAQLIKPILRGRDIKRYSYEWAGLWIINVHNGYTIDDSSLATTSCHSELSQESEESLNGSKKDISGKSPQYDNAHTDKNKQKIKIPPINIDEYPTLKAYFDKVASGGKQGKGKGFYNRDDKGITPYNLRNCAYLPEFAKPKIVYSEIVREPQFYLDNGEFKFGYFYAEATSFILSGNKNFKSSLEYLLGLLHSKLCTFAFKEFYAGGGLGESVYRYKKAFLENLPIPKITQSQEAEFIAIVREIIECKKSLENFNNEVYPHCNTIKTHEVQTSKALSGWGIDKGEGATSPNSSPSTLSKKEQNATLKDLESRLDSMVFSLYGLNDEEIKLISNGGGGRTI